MRCTCTHGQMSSRPLDLFFPGEAAVCVPEDSVLGFREECDCLSGLAEVSLQVLPASALHVSSLLLLVQRTCVSFT